MMRDCSELEPICKPGYWRLKALGLLVVDLADSNATFGTASVAKAAQGFVGMVISGYDRCHP